MNFLQYNMGMGKRERGEPMCSGNSDQGSQRRPPAEALAGIVKAKEKLGNHGKAWGLERGLEDARQRTQG